MPEKIISNDKLDRSKKGVIKAWFDYNPDTGEITWKEWVSPDWYKFNACYLRFIKEKAGNTVKFSSTSKGHLHTRAGGVSGIYAHHIAWFLTYGKMPDNEIDHIDGNPENNCINNLRDVSSRLNSRNRKIRSDNTSGYTGVYWSKQQKKWQCTVYADGYNKHIGFFETALGAAQARERYIEMNKSLGFTDRHGKADSLLRQENTYEILQNVPER